MGAELRPDSSIVMLVTPCKHHFDIQPQTSPFAGYLFLLVVVQLAQTPLIRPLIYGIIRLYDSDLAYRLPASLPIRKDIQGGTPIGGTLMPLVTFSDVSKRPMHHAALICTDLQNHQPTPRIKFNLDGGDTER